MAKKNLRNVNAIVGDGIALMRKCKIEELTPHVSYKKVTVNDAVIDVPVLQVEDTRLAFYETDSAFICIEPTNGVSMKLASKHDEEGSCKTLYDFVYLESNKEVLPRTAIIDVLRLARHFSVV